MSHATPTPASWGDPCCRAARPSTSGTRVGPSPEDVLPGALGFPRLGQADHGHVGGHCARTEGHLWGQPLADRPGGTVCAGPGVPGPMSPQDTNLTSSRVLEARATPCEGDIGTE